MLILLLFIHAPFSSSTSTPYFTKLDLFHRKTMSTENAPVLLQAAAKQDKSSGLAAGNPGVLGLGRGPLSLVSQLGVDRFSYCLPSIGKPNGRLLFGSQATIKTKTVLSTPILSNPSQPSLYYVSLQGITVGGTLLSIPKNTFELNKDGTGGMIIGSGNVFPRLEKTAFQLVKQEFKSQLNLAFADRSDSGFDACFSIPSGHTLESVPKLVYHFDGADLQLHRSDNYLAFDKKDVLCLMILESRDGLSIFGNIHQQNMQMHFDLQKEVVSFVPDVQCDEI
ncbi:hypothetical protein J5N97_005032 [Dioscorea zingiberensis]|uniref:Peptidase A1 domain-containing protein n=1 Tax=Dioscorea zingiberensis TaxID=325984 RepID=A0A9D5D7C1_9LILI|nr:hypothetical protein J5N97_005032 [Dioscorea zingiberensis]